MGQIPIHLIIVFIILILLSGFFSVVETAFASVNQIRLKTYVNKGKRGAKKALEISENYDEALSTILVGNNLVNIAAATISAQIATEIWGPKLGVFISTFVVTLLVLIVGDILPKSLAKENAEICTLLTAGILFLLMKLFKPANWILLKIPKWVSKLLGCTPNTQSFTEEEIKVMLDMSEEEGVLNHDEKELVRRSLEFDDIVASDIVKPRTEVLAIDVNASEAEIKQIFYDNSYAKLPVYEGNIDNVVGILSARDFFTVLVRDKSFDIKKIMKEPFFIPESMKVSILLKKLKKYKNNIAIITDEYGGTLGLITLEDILERIVGDIYDLEDDYLDEKSDLIKEVEPSVYMVKGQYLLTDFVTFFKVEAPNSMSKTLGGWIVESVQMVPEKGREIKYQHLILRVGDVRETKIETVLVDARKTSSDENQES